MTFQEFKKVAINHIGCKVKCTFKMNHTGKVYTSTRVIYREDAIYWSKHYADPPSPYALITYIDFEILTDEPKQKPIMLSEITRKAGY